MKLVLSNLLSTLVGNNYLISLPIQIAIEPLSIAVWDGMRINGFIYYIIQNIPLLGQICHSKKVFFHTDAAQVCLVDVV